jgi:hypothetical protein
MNGIVKKLMVDSSTGEIAKSPEKQPRSYQILRGEAQNVEPRWSTEWLLSEYVRCTDGIIGKMDGTIPLTNRDVYKKDEHGRLHLEKRDLPPPEAVIWLDKSARPVSWMVRELWSMLARTPGTEYNDWNIPKRPSDHYLNINKEDWLRRMGVPPHELEDANDRDVNLGKIDPKELQDHLARIRAVFTNTPIREDNVDEAWNHPTVFDRKHVMIVDEVESSGKTLMIAKMLLSAAIPDAVFSGEYWSRPGRKYLNNGVPDKKDAKVQFSSAWVPVWYDRSVTTGRGIGDRNFVWPEIADKRGYPISWQSQVGRHVLSTRPHNPGRPGYPSNDQYELIKDSRADELREDIKQLAGDLRQKKVLYNPSRERDEDLAPRIEAINGMSFAEWKIKKVAIEPKAIQ